MVPAVAEPRTPPFLLAGFVLGVVLLGLLPLVIIDFVPHGPSVVTPCGRELGPPDFVPLNPGETRLVFADYGGGDRWTIWSNASTTYSLFILNEGQYVSYGNTTGTNGTLPYHPPNSYWWTSGTTLETNNTFALASGTWYMMVYNPSAASATVSLEISECSAV